MKKVILGLVLSLILTEHAWSQEHGFSATTLGEYLEQAQAANPQLEAFKQHYEAAMQRIPQSSSLPDPMLQVTNFVESVQTRTGPQENVVMFSQRIPWLGKLDKREQGASAQAEALWYAYQNSQLMLARKVSLSFYEYGYVEQATRFTKENLKLLEELEPIVEEKVRSGGDINALLRLKVEIGKVADKYESFQQIRLAQSAEIAELLALPHDTVLPWPVWEAPEVSHLDGSALSLAIQLNNPELAMLERKIASAEAKRELARLESYPDFTFGINYIQIGDPSVNPTTPGAGDDAWGVTVGVSIPLWLGKNRAGRAEALAAKRATENEYEHRLNFLRSELSASLARLDDANRRLKLYGEELLGLAEQAVENSRSSYQSGRTGILEVIDSERSLLELQMLYWRAATDASQQRVLIQTLVNQPLF